jgi:hypothetical protein
MLRTMQYNVGNIANSLRVSKPFDVAFIASTAANARQFMVAVRGVYTYGLHHDSRTILSY